MKKHLIFLMNVEKASGKIKLEDEEILKEKNWL